MKATVARRISRRSSGRAAVLSPYGLAVASSVIVAAAWGMRAGLAMLVVGLAFSTYYRLAAGRGLKATPIGKHEAETADALAILAASNTRATLARLPPGFTVFNDLKF